MCEGGGGGLLGTRYIFIYKYVCVLGHLVRDMYTHVDGFKGVNLL